VYVAWYSVSVATSYRVERKLESQSTWTLLAELPASPTEFVDETAAPNTTYSYRIFAVNTAGTSGASAVRTITTPGLPLPTVPQNLTAHAFASNKITVSWSDSEYESGYRLERNIGEEPWEVISQLPANSTSFLDSGLVNGTYYNYRLVAFNANGEESVSTEVNVLAALTGAMLQDDFDPSVDLGVWSSLSGGQAITGSSGFLSGRALWFGAGGTRSAITVPVDLLNGGTLLFQFRAGNQSVDGNTHWNNSEANENVVLEYSVSGGPWEILSILATEYPSHHEWTAFEITLPNEARSESTRFRWRQLSNSGVSQDTWAIDDVEIRGVLPAPPAPPAFILANASAAKAVAITWASSALATHYAVERRTPSSDWVVVGNTTSYETYFTDTTALPATAYSYRVLAGNTGGLSEPSQYAFVTTWSVLQEWRFQNYGSIVSNGAAADLALDSSGVANLLKYAFNMSKDDRYLVLHPEAGKGLPHITMGGDLLQVAYLRRRNPASSGIRYIVEFSSDLATWSEVGTELVSDPVDENFDYVVCRDSPPVGHAGGRFARVRVETAE
jgi:hypothetical protein